MFVICEICGKSMKTRINGSHLKRMHNISIQEYKFKFPNSNIGHHRQKNNSYQCKICNTNVVSSQSFSRHLTSKHNIGLEDYYIKYIHNDKVGICKCGCGNKTTFKNIDSGFNDYIIRHSPVWNKGLTKDNDTRLKNIYYNWVPWNKNLTKNDDARIKKQIISFTKTNTDVVKKKRVNSYIKTMQSKYGVDNIFQLDSIKIKSKHTLIKKYGVENCQFSNKIKYRWKTYTLLDGRKITYQGYENFAIPTIIKQYTIQNIIFDKKEIPKINYTENGKIRKYCADFFIKNYNILTEVKSDYTYKLHKTNIDNKITGAINSGYKIRILVYDRKGILLLDELHE